MKTLLLVLAIALPFQISAADEDSVYSWGPWSQGIKPAAGAVPGITPAPVEQPRVSFRPNENSAFSRRIELPTLPEVTPDSVQLPQVQIPVGQANTNPRTGRGR